MTVADRKALASFAESVQAMRMQSVYDKRRESLRALADIRRTARVAVVISGLSLVALLGALLIFHR